MTAKNLRKLSAACRAAERRYAAADRLVGQCLHSHAFNAAVELRAVLRAELDAADAAYLAAVR